MEQWGQNQSHSIHNSFVKGPRILLARPRISLHTVVSEYILFIVRYGISCYSFLDLEQTITLLKCSRAVPIFINGMSNHFKKRKSIRAFGNIQKLFFLVIF